MKRSHSILSTVALAALLVAPPAGQAQLGGTPEAVARARAMVATMGGLELWRALRSVHFVHEWDLSQRPDRYLEHEILDLEAPRSYVTMESETYHRIRAYSPEHGYWNVVNGTFRRASDQELEAALERAPFSLYRLAAAVGRDDANVTVRVGSLPDRPSVEALEFAGPDGVPGGWLVLNARNEPVIWATTQYEYALGPLARFGNLWVPDWGVTGQGRVRYQMVSLTGSSEAPDPELFVPPPGP